MTIFNFELPKSLIKIHQQDTFIIDQKLWQKMFPDEIRTPYLYSFKEIHRETESIRSDFYDQVLSQNIKLGDNNEHLYPSDIFWFGRKEKNIVPGYINGNKILLIGEIGPDMIIGLYYNDKEPSVVYFTNDLLWVELASSFDEFLQKIQKR